MSTYPIFQVNAFAEAPYTGNPAAVVPLDAWLDDAKMQAIAMENNLSETAFFVPTPDDPDSDYHLRWFTPATEVDLCGHATLASSYVLTEHLGFGGPTIRFRSRSGLLQSTIADDKICLNFPEGESTPTRVPDGLATALGGIEPVGYLRGKKDMAILASEHEVLSVVPDLEYIRQLDAHSLIVTAEGEACDVASRCFGPKVGIEEDPVTGSAHCFIAPYWQKRLNKEVLHCRQVSSRGGDLWCTVDDGRVSIAGRARLFMSGSIYL